MTDRSKPRMAALVGLLLVMSSAVADDALRDIANFRDYSPQLSSSGQPDAAQLEAIHDAGFERVIFLAYTDSHGSLANEDQLIERLGMQFAHVPVDWDAPTAEDFRMFAAIMQQAPDTKTLVHCQVNYRASTFSFLYRVLFEHVPLDTAKNDLDSVWVPNQTWTRFIFDVLEENGVSPDCEGCLWEMR